MAHSGGNEYAWYRRQPPAAGHPHVSSSCNGAGGCRARLTGSAQTAIHRRLRHCKRPMPLADLERDPARSPRGMLPARLQHRRLQHRRHLVRTLPRPVRSVRQTFQAVGPYLPSQACRLCRDTPIAAATSVTVRPSLITASTSRYRCSATLISLIRECQGSAEVTVNHQPKLCKASAEVEKSSLNRGNTQIMELTGRLELPTCCLQDSCATDCATPARRLFALMEALYR